MVAFAGDALICVFTDVERFISESSDSNLSTLLGGQSRISNLSYSETQNISMSPSIQDLVVNSPLSEMRSLLKPVQEEKDELAIMSSARTSDSESDRNPGENKSIAPTHGELTQRLSPSQHDIDPYLELNCCRRALECAMVLSQQKEGSFSTHCAVSYGSMTLTILGGLKEDWVYLLNGICIGELGKCLDKAKTQQVVITKECLKNVTPLYVGHKVEDILESKTCERDKVQASLEENDMSIKSDPGIQRRNKSNKPDAIYSSSAQTTPLSNDNFPSFNSHNISDLSNYVDFEEADEDIYLIRSVKTSLAPTKTNRRLKNIIQSTTSAILDSSKIFIPRPVLSAIYSDTLDHLSELRQVVTMFVELESYSSEKYNDPKNPFSLDPFFEIIQEALHESGGYLRQFVVDDKGCVAIVMWGVPHYSYANNTMRGLFCGTAINTRAKMAEIDTSVGLTYGYCYCGNIGGTIRREYVVIGDQVNMAARFMSKAKGRVLFDSYFKDNLPSEFVHEFQDFFTQVETMKLKGISLVSYYSSACSLVSRA